MKNKHKLLKRIGATILSMVCSISLISTSLGGLGGIFTSSALTYKQVFPEPDVVIARACKLLGTGYKWGAKGSSSPYGNGNSHSTEGGTIYSANDIKNKGYGIDCSGLIYWTMSSMGYSGSGFSFQNPVPVDTAHWLNANGTRKLTYDGVTANLEVEKENLPTPDDKTASKTYEYWEKADGSNILPGSPVIAKSTKAGVSDHSWIYIGEFNSREKIVDYLENTLGVDPKAITSKTVYEVPLSENGGKFVNQWRIEANSTYGVVINNGTDGKVIGAYNASAYRVTSENGSITINKQAEDNQISDIEFKLSWSENGTSKSVTQKTNASGKITFEDLALTDSSDNAIKYTVEEINVATRYVTPVAQSITLKNHPNNDYSVNLTFKNELKKGDFSLTKTFSENGIPVDATEKQYSSVLFKLSYNLQSTYVTYTKNGDGDYTYKGTTTNKDGSATNLRVGTNGKLIVRDLPIRKYRLEEKQTAANFKVAAAHNIEIEYNKTTKDTVDNAGTTGDLTVQKKFINTAGYTITATTEMLNSVKFTVKQGDKYLSLSGNSSGEYEFAGYQNSPATIVLNGSGNFDIANLPTGTFKLCELATANDYKLAGDVEFSVTVDKTTNMTVNNIQNSGQLDITKAVQNYDGTPITDTALLEEIYSATKFIAYVENADGSKQYISAIPDIYGDNEYNSERGWIYNYNGLTTNAAAATKFRLNSDADGHYSADFGVSRILNIPNSISDIKFEEVESYEGYGFVEKILPSENRQNLNFTNRSYYFVAGFNKYADGTADFLSDGTFGLFAKEDVVVNENVIYTAGQEIETKVSNGETTYFDTLLPAIGSYYVQEISAPLGYKLDDTQYDISVEMPMELTNARLSDRIIDIYNQPISFDVSKQDENGAEVVGATMQLVDETSSVVDEWVSDGTSHTVTGVTAGNYTLHEEYAPDGYCLATDISLTIDNYGKIFVNDTEVTVSSENGLPLVVMVDDITKVEISKTDLTTGKPVIGAKLEITDRDGTTVDKWTTTADAHILNGTLVAGETYTLTETFAPDGYIIANSIQFTVSTDGTVDKVVMEDEQKSGSIKVHKITERQLDIEGISFILSGTSFFGNEVNVTAVTDEYGIADFPNVPIGTYTITEDKKTVPLGYLIADDKSVTVTYNETTEVTITNKWQTGKISVFKTDSETKTPLSNAKYTIYATADVVVDGKTYEKGDAIETLVTDNDGKATAEYRYPVLNDFEVKETKAPEGYVRSDETQTIRLEYNNEVKYTETTVNVKDTKQKAVINVTKQNYSNVALEGAEFEVYTASNMPEWNITKGQLVGTLTTDKNGNASSDGKFTLYAGVDYLLLETKAPDGYVSENYSKILKADYDETLEYQPINVLINNKPTSITISKKDFSTGKLIPDCGIEILDENKNVLEQGTTDKNGEVTFTNLPYGKYFYREYNAPEGYQIDTTPFAFEITADKGIIKAEMTNEVITGKLIIIKYDENKNVLEGVEFEVLDKDGNVVTTGKTNNDGKFECELPYGDYQYHEKKALDGYDADTKYYDFSITKQGQVVEGEVINRHSGGGYGSIPDVPNDSTVTTSSTPNVHTGMAVGGSISLGLLIGAIAVVTSKRKKK